MAQFRCTLLRGVIACVTGPLSKKNYGAFLGGANPEPVLEADDFYGSARTRNLSSSSASLLQLCAKSKYAFSISGSFV